MRRLTRPGGRTTYYCVDDDMWETVIRRRIASMMSFSKITLEGMSLIGPETPRATRLRAAHDFSEWMATRLAHDFSKWVATRLADASRRRPGPGRGR